MYGHEHDGRRTASKQYVQALENRVKQLETQLHRRRDSVADSSHEADADHRPVRSHRSLSEYEDGSEAMAESSDDRAEDSGEKIGAIRVVSAGQIHGFYKD